MSYFPLAIANTFILHFSEKCGGIEHMKLQKLVYCAYGWWLVSEGLEAERLVSEPPEISKFGPVFCSLYNILRVFGREPLKEPKSAFPFSPRKLVPSEDQKVLELISWVWERYGHLTGLELSELTHKTNSAWYKVLAEKAFVFSLGEKIPDKYIYEEFLRVYNDFEGKMSLN